MYTGCSGVRVLRPEVQHLTASTSLLQSASGKASANRLSPLNNVPSRIPNDSAPNDFSELRDWNQNCSYVNCSSNSLMPSVLMELATTLSAALCRTPIFEKFWMLPRTWEGIAPA